MRSSRSPNEVANIDRLTLTTAYYHGNNPFMSVAEETAAIVAGLPGDKARSVLYFARFLAEEAEDQAWEKSLAAAAKLPRFQERLAQVDRDIENGQSTPLDESQL